MRLQHRAVRRRLLTSTQPLWLARVHVNGGTVHCIMCRIYNANSRFAGTGQRSEDPLSYICQRAQPPREPSTEAPGAQNRTGLERPQDTREFYALYRPGLSENEPSPGPVCMFGGGGVQESHIEILTSSPKSFHRGTGATSIGRGQSKMLFGQSKAGIDPILENVGTTPSDRVETAGEGGDWTVFEAEIPQAPLDFRPRPSVIQLVRIRSSGPRVERTFDRFERSRSWSGRRDGKRRGERRRARESFVRLVDNGAAVGNAGRRQEGGSGIHMGTRFDMFDTYSFS